MNRSRRFVANTMMGYGLILANLLYTLVSIPLALRYLDKEVFGLWALALQVTGYLMLLDMGITGALSRFLADAKDHPDQPEYARIFVIGCVVFSVQGVLIALCGSLFAVFAPSLFAIPDALAPSFRNVLIFLSLISGASVAFRALGSPLWAFQRLDVTYALNIMTLILGVLTLWLGFLAGWGIYSFAFAGVPALFLSPILTFFVCKKNHFYPPKIRLHDFDWSMFRRIFLFGKDVLLISAGSQIVNASQIIILSRWVSLDAAATFSIGTKFFTMGQQFTGRIIESSAPGLTELFVRNDSSRFRDNFHRIFLLTIFLALVIGITLICSNTWIVSLWTSGKIQWHAHFDLLLALLLIFTSASRCITAIFGIVAKLQPIRSVYFLEAILFVALAIPASSRFGIAGVLVASLLAHIAITSTIPLRAARSYLDGNAGIVRALWIACLITCAIYLGTLPWTQYVNLSVFAISERILIFAIGILGSWFLLLPHSLRAQVLASSKRFFPFHS